VPLPYVVENRRSVRIARYDQSKVFDVAWTSQIGYCTVRNLIALTAENCRADARKTVFIDNEDLFIVHWSDISNSDAHIKDFTSMCKYDLSPKYLSDLKQKRIILASYSPVTTEEKVILIIQSVSIRNRGTKILSFMNPLDTYT